MPNCSEVRKLVVTCSIRALDWEPFSPQKIDRELMNADVDRQGFTLIFGYIDFIHGECLLVVIIDLMLSHAMPGRPMRDTKCHLAISRRP